MSMTDVGDVRKWVLRAARFQKRLHNAVYPARCSSLILLNAIVAAVSYLQGCVPLKCVLISSGLWLIGVFALRNAIKLLLLYKGWMHENGRNKSISKTTRLWGLLLKTLQGRRKPGLYSFQGCLPRLPVPSVHETVRRYLRSVRPLRNDDEYDATVARARAFENGIAMKLQRYLWLKSWWHTNYVADWWEEFAYLRCRKPLMINSNFYENDAILVLPKTNQAARGASIINSCLEYRGLIDRQELDPLLIQGMVPLCSWQYERLFNTARIPGIGTDSILHLADSDHIVVYHKGRYFKVLITHKGRLLEACEIQIQLQQILDDTSKPLPGEERLAALTASERDTWAKYRTRFFSRGTNKYSLDLIERAAFCVTLDDVPYEYDENDPSKLNDYSRSLFHGKGYDRWFDKSFTLCVGTNGRIGFNSEHSWGDAAVIAHLGEHVIVLEATHRYDESGNCVGTPDIIPPQPVRLKWDLHEECQAAIEAAVTSANQLISDVKLHILVHKKYGKGFIKTCRLSPDAYLQMALQLAYYKDSGTFHLTYEASMTRLYREARTETVRPCSIESSAWVKSMQDTNATNAERIALLRAACKRHQVAYQQAMCGKGVDRHLFCLYVVAKYLNLDSAFLNEAVGEPWRLSTSQTPQSQTNFIDFRKYTKCISAGGGFGPVADDGYGVSYIISGEDVLFFHVTSRPSSLKTDCYRFVDNIEKALDDMRKLFEESTHTKKLE